MNDVFEKINEFVESGLGIDPELVLIQLVATLILFLVVLKFLWKPMTELIEKRRDIILSELAEAKEANERAHKLQSEMTSEYEAAKAEIKALIDQAVKEGRQEKTSIINDAKKEAERRIQSVESEIEREIQQANKKIKDSIVDIAFAAAEKIVKREIDRETHEDLVKDLIEGVDQS